MGPGVHSGERFVPYGELLRHAGQFARGYDEIGIGTGDSVAVLLRNDPVFLEASLGTVVLGATPVPINWHWRADEVGYLLRNSGAKAVVVHDDLHPAVADAIPAGVEVIGVPTPPEGAAAYGLAGAAPADAHRHERSVHALAPRAQAAAPAPRPPPRTATSAGPTRSRRGTRRPSRLPRASSTRRGPRAGPRASSA